MAAPSLLKAYQSKKAIRQCFSMALSECRLLLGNIAYLLISFNGNVLIKNVNQSNTNSEVKKKKAKICKPRKYFYSCNFFS